MKYNKIIEIAPSTTGHTVKFSACHTYERLDAMTWRYLGSTCAEDVMFPAELEAVFQAELENRSNA